MRPGASGSAIKRVVTCEVTCVVSDARVSKHLETQWLNSRHQDLTGLVLRALTRKRAFERNIDCIHCK
jgi:hypothetical protein